MVAAFIGRLATAACAMKTSSWSIARNTYEGPAETGSVAISAPIAGPERSVIIEAETTNAAATAMRSATERMKASSGDIVRRSPAVHSLSPLARGEGPTSRAPAASSPQPAGPA